MGVGCSTQCLHLRGEHCPDMRVLLACEVSEIGKEQFLVKGHDAHSCDLLPGERGLPNHHQCDVRSLLNDSWDMMIAFPPCTYLSNSGVRWLHERSERRQLLSEACDFFNILLDAPIPMIAIENPIQHRYARERIRKPDQIIQPYHFGDMESKATCLWLIGLPPLMANFSGGESIKQSVWRTPPSKDRGRIRSRTFPGIAKAMAEQWG